MPRFFTLFLIFSVFKLQATDTLTRAQVYNFSAGDIFDYREISYSGAGQLNTGYYYTINTSYSRYIVSKSYYSIDSSIRYIIRQKIFPQPLVYDTLTVYNLNGYAAFTDSNSTGGSAVFGCPLFFVFEDTINLNSQPYFGRTTNSLAYKAAAPGGCSNLLAERFGSVMTTAWDGTIPFAPQRLDTTILIYFYNSTETWGTPYFDFTTAIPPLIASYECIALYPTINDGTFNVKISDASLLPLKLEIFDITGRKVRQLTLENQNNNISIEPCAGVYIWKTINGDNFMQTGKIVIH